MPVLAVSQKLRVELVFVGAGWLAWAFGSRNLFKVFAEWKEIIAVAVGSRLITQQVCDEPLIVARERELGLWRRDPGTVLLPFRGGDRRDRAVEIHRHCCGRDFCHVRFSNRSPFYCYGAFPRSAAGTAGVTMQASRHKVTLEPRWRFFAM